MKQRCVIIGASPAADAGFIGSCLTGEDYLVCADGGYDRLRQIGRTPDLWIGDFDSIPHPQNPPCELITLPARKDDTDTLYCLRECIRRGFRDFLLLGMTGGRADHTFANYSVLLFLSHHGCHGVIRDEHTIITMVTDELTLKGHEGEGFGIFAFGCPTCRVTLSGFAYEAAQTELSTDFPIGVSNTILSAEAHVTVHSGTALCMILTA